ncbi:RHS repeat-associated core domain-containing protein [Brumimicrobium oceani]|uniref:RHS repeat-associated core domain-containing protein n=1 Tax=Brumimicrobium oceani TaxID=2100725 RepID=A0A2U2XEU0_9FLAO|nr:RHS repeat-associated core domain-containing protein [Brumimicrobium oceani]PWH86250.1 hypothetical protein DIT68_03140 [Brumimicrobium oceani]
MRRSNRGLVLGSYRYGFNGMEKDDNIKGEGNSYDFGARIYDPRVGRWLSRDALEGKKPFLSPYQAFKNNPLMYTDPDGNDEYLSYIITNEKTGKTTRLDVLTAHSTKIIAFGSSKDVHSNNYYDFRTVKTITQHQDGTTSITTNYEILYEDGIKDFDLSYGSSNVKPNGYIKDEADGWTWGVGLSPETQPGGFRLTSDDGGASPTKTISENDVESRDIGDLLDALGALKNGSLGSDDADKIKDIVDMVQDLNELVPLDGGGGTGSGSASSSSSGESPSNGVNNDSIWVKQKHTWITPAGRDSKIDSTKVKKGEEHKVSNRVK